MLNLIKELNYIFYLQGKSSLDATNLRGDTPLSMLQVHAGSIWIGQKIVEKVREHSQTTMRRNLFVRITLDKVCLNRT